MLNSPVICDLISFFHDYLTVKLSLDATWADPPAGGDSQVHFGDGQVSFHTVQLRGAWAVCTVLGNERNFLSSLEGSAVDPLVRLVCEGGGTYFVSIQIRELRKTLPFTERVRKCSIRNPARINKDNLFNL